MPTGYTAGVQDGKITSFSDFAMQCARAMGACITMRDDPHDVEIPEKFEPSLYRKEKIVEIKAEIEEINRLSSDQIEIRAKKEYEDEVERIHSTLVETATSKARYTSMLHNVRAWTPPTSDHQGLKDFMIEQLESSLEHDCSNMERYYAKQLDELTILNAVEWRDDWLESLNKDLVYYTKEHEDEIKRTSDRTQWIKDLRESLKE